MARYGAAMLAGKCWGSSVAGTLLVNVIGCFALGAVYGIMQGRTACISEEMRLLISMGFLGALTTFSTLNWEVFAMLRSGRLCFGAFYLVVSCVLGLLCTAGGYYLAHNR